MEYKITEAHIVKLSEFDKNLKDTLHVTLLIDGRECHLGGLPADMTRKELDEYIAKEADRIKRKSMESEQPESNIRPDLLDEE